MEPVPGLGWKHRPTLHGVPKLSKPQCPLCNMERRVGVASEGGHQDCLILPMGMMRDNSQSPSTEDLWVRI